MHATDHNGARKFVNRKNGIDEHDEESSSFLFKSLIMNGFGMHCHNEEMKVNSNYNNAISTLPESSFLLSPLFPEINIWLSNYKNCADFPKID